MSEVLNFREEMMRFAEQIITANPDIAQTSDLKQILGDGCDLVASLLDKFDEDDGRAAEACCAALALLASKAEVFGVEAERGPNARLISFEERLDSHAKMQTNLRTFYQVVLGVRARRLRQGPAIV